MLEIKIGVNLEMILGVGSKTGSKNSVLAFLKCTDGSVLAFLKCMDGSVLVYLKCMDGSVLAHPRFPMQSTPTRFPQSGKSEVPQLLCKKSTKMSYMKQNEPSMHYRRDHTEFLSCKVLICQPIEPFAKSKAKKFVEDSFS